MTQSFVLLRPGFYDWLLILCIDECALPSGVSRELRLGVAQTVMDVASDLLSEYGLSVHGM